MKSHPFVIALLGAIYDELVALRLNGEVAIHRLRLEKPFALGATLKVVEHRPDFLVGEALEFRRVHFALLETPLAPEQCNLIDVRKNVTRRDVARDTRPPEGRRR